MSSHLGEAIKNKVKGVRDKAAAPLVKAIRYFPDKHHKYQMEKSDQEYKFLKSFNDRKKTGAPISDKEYAQVEMFKNRNK